MSDRAYDRVVLKLSGESFKGEGTAIIDHEVVRYIAEEIKDCAATGVQIALTVGGGNIWRGAEHEALGMDRPAADSAGMLATVINAIALQDSLEHIGIAVRTQTSISMPSVAEPYIRRRALRHLEKGRVVIFAGGTGDPYMSTDTAAGLRALEINADALVMAKNNVDGVYTADPNIDPEATKIRHMTHIDALRRRTGALDSTAISLCMDNGLPIVVFDMFKPGNLLKAVSGADIGTLISETAPAPVGGNPIVNVRARDIANALGISEPTLRKIMQGEEVEFVSTPVGGNPIINLPAEDVANDLEISEPTLRKSAQQEEAG